MLFPTGPVTCLVGFIINLPGGVPSQDIHDVAVWLDEDLVELVVQVKLHPYMTGLKFFSQMKSVIGPGKKPKYDPLIMHLFELHLQMYQANLRLMAFDDIYYKDRILLDGYNVTHGLVTEDDWEILQSKIPDSVELAILVVTLRTPTEKCYDYVPEEPKKGPK